MAAVELEAGEFYYVEHGDRAAPPQVLLHGMLSDCSTWAEVAVPAVSGFRAVRHRHELRSQRRPGRPARHSHPPQPRASIYQF
jgi:hypothetical protein